MSRPTRDTTAGRVYLDLQARARREGRPTDEIFVLYILERFLFRLSRSAHRQRVVLKGGMLLAALDERRPTRDVDLLARATQNDVESVASLVRDILRVEIVLSYPLATVLSEKIVAMIDRGDTTTRERDFADVVLLTRRHSVDGAELRRAIESTGRHRQPELRALADVIVTLGEIRQSA